jgi:hypothetical protein
MGLSDAEIKQEFQLTTAETRVVRKASKKKTHAVDSSE